MGLPLPRKHILHKHDEPNTLFERSQHHRRCEKMGPHKRRNAGGTMEKKSCTLSTSWRYRRFSRAGRGRGNTPSGRKRMKSRKKTHFLGADASSIRPLFYPCYFIRECGTITCGTTESSSNRAKQTVPCRSTAGDGLFCSVCRKSPAKAGLFRLKAVK